MSLTIPRKAVITLFCIITFLLAAGSLQADENPGIQTEGDSYIIGKGDTLEVVVWKEEELSRTVKVRVDGRISLPLADDIMAAGRTPMELKKEVNESLSKFIEGPEVTVIVEEQGSKAYYMLGEIEGNGEYPLDKDLTLLQALAKAKGFSEWANKHNLLLLRRTGDGGEKRIRLNYEDIVSGKSPEQNLMLEPGDTLVVLD